LRQISYLSIANFEIELHRILNPSLKNRPVVIAVEKSDRAGLLHVSDEARKEGLKNGIPVAVAKRLCRDMVLISPKLDLYKRAQFKLIDKIAQKIPLFEIDKFGNFFLDLSGLRKLYGPCQDLAQCMRKEISSDFKLPSTFGISKNKLVSKLAVEDLTSSEEINLVPTGTEKPYISPLSLELLPISQKLLQKVKKPTSNIFKDLRLETIGDISALSRLQLLVAFGAHAELFFRNSRGIDNSPVRAPVKKLSIHAEYYLKEQTNHTGFLLEKIKSLFEIVFFKLRKMGKLSGSFLIGIRYSDLKFVEKRKLTKILFRHYHQIEADVKEVFYHILSRRTSVIYLYVELDHLANLEVQLSLFDGQNVNEKLESQLDQIKLKFGDQAIFSGSSF